MQAAPRVVVAGSANMDLVARAQRHPRAGETVLGDAFRIFPGGKGANQAVAAARLGAQAVLVAKLGVDVFGDELEEFLRAEDVDVSHLGRTPEHASGTGLIVVDAHSQNTIVVVPGANAVLEPEEVRVEVRPGDVFVSQLEIPLDTVRAFLEHGKVQGAMTLLNPSPAQQLPRALLEAVEILVLNETEAALLSGAESLDAGDALAVESAARELRTRAEQIVVVTLGDRGAIAVVGDASHAIPARRVRAVDPTGAGDCFVGALAARLVAGAPFLEALHFANVAASLCVQVLGAGPSFPVRDTVEAAL